MKKVFLYFIYIAAVTIFFIYYLFPSEEVKNYIAFKISNANPDITVTIDNVKPVFPPGLGLYAISFFSEGQVKLIESEQMKITPGLLSLFRNKKIFSFKGKSCQGILEGKASFIKSDTSPKIAAVTAKLSGIRINDIPAVKNLEGYKISGILDGDIIYSENGESDEIANAKLTVSDSAVAFSESDSKKMGLLAPLLKVGEFKFKTINADMVIDNNRKLQIKGCTIKGEQMNGDISGDIRLKAPLKKSVLNLKATIRPHPTLVATLGKAASFLFKKGSFTFKISGTFEKPRF
ncbi:type II secretion system protein GspN [Desulfococcaceae bacterium HSG8]|nr:type II secretion system protein GspN [Desulfococcaceae bacterium HSG8]